MTALLKNVHQHLTLQWFTFNTSDSKHFYSIQQYKKMSENSEIYPQSCKRTTQKYFFKKKKEKALNEVWWP